MRCSNERPTGRYVYVTPATLITAINKTFRNLNTLIPLKVPIQQAYKIYLTTCFSLIVKISGTAASIRQKILVASVRAGEKECLTWMLYFCFWNLIQGHHWSISIQITLVKPRLSECSEYILHFSVNYWNISVDYILINLLFQTMSVSEW